MKPGAFESSLAGERSRIEARTRLECGVCWWVYDPAHGDEVWQIPAGTPFTAQPEHWRCPGCDAASTRFMVLADDGAGDAGTRRDPSCAEGERALADTAARLRAAYGRVDARMRDLPVYNVALRIDVVGLRRTDDGIVGIVATPWCMNLLRLPSDDGPPRVEGTSRELAFPSGRYAFVRGHLDGVGAVDLCFLFSPMDLFHDPAVVWEVAEHAMRELFTAPAPPEAPEPGAPPRSRVSRRDFLRGSSATASG